MSTLRNRVLQRIKEHEDETQQQKDLEHAQWSASPAGLFEIIKFPKLGILPSQRTTEDHRDLLLYQLKLKRKNPAWEMR